MEFKELQLRDFLGQIYRTQPLKVEQFLAFKNALKIYKEKLLENIYQNQRTIVSNVLMPFLNALNLSAESGQKQDGNSEIILALRKENIEVIIEPKHPNK